MEGIRCAREAESILYEDEFTEAIVDGEISILRKQGVWEVDADQTFGSTDWVNQFTNIPVLDVRKSLVKPPQALFFWQPEINA